MCVFLGIDGGTKSIDISDINRLARQNLITLCASNKQLFGKIITLNDQFSNKFQVRQKLFTEATISGVQSCWTAKEGCIYLLGPAGRGGPRRRVRHPDGQEDAGGVADDVRADHAAP